MLHYPLNASHLRVRCPQPTAGAFRGIMDAANPVFDLWDLEVYVAKKYIADALKSALPRLNGTVLDIGCGDMAYRDLLLAPPSGAARYLGLDLEGGVYAERSKPDLLWRGDTMPLDTASVDCALLMEVLEHCPEPERVLKETHRVLKPGGLLFFTVPFLWPLHDVPHDEYRYTPFALERHLRNVEFGDVAIHAYGGWDASLAQMIALWVRRRPMPKRRRAVLQRLLGPVVRKLMASDRPPSDFMTAPMVNGLYGFALKASAAQPPSASEP